MLSCCLEELFILTLHLLYTHMCILLYFSHSVYLTFMILWVYLCCSYTVKFVKRSFLFEVYILVCVGEISKNLYGGGNGIIECINMNKIHSHQVVLEKGFRERTAPYEYRSSNEKSCGVLKRVLSSWSARA